MKRKLSLLLTFLLIFVIATPVMAAGSGTITIENAKVGKNYAGYKIFDAEYTGDKAVYTVEEASYWYDVIMDEGEDAPFDLIQRGSQDVYDVVRKEGAGALTDVELFTWFEDNLPPAPDLTEQEADSTTVTWSGVESGYYFITSSLGTAVTITNARPDATIIDKNDKPSWETPEDPGAKPGKNVSATGVDGTYAPTSTTNKGDTVFYKLNAYVPTYYGAEKVTKYVIRDNMEEGLVLDTGSVEVSIAGFRDLVENTDYRLIEGDHGFQLTLLVEDIDNYPSDASVEITFTATATEDATKINKNMADLDWETEDNPYDPEDPNEPFDPDEPYDPEDPYDPNEPDRPDRPPHEETETYTFGLKFEKVNEGDEALEGAKFVLSYAGGSFVPLVDLGNGYYRVDTENGTALEIEAGVVDIFGLDVGNYELEEILAPDGYNILKEPVLVTITKANVDGDHYLASFDVVNKAGIELPETGGIGTKIFYISGGLMMLFSVVYLVAKRRTSTNYN